MSFATITHLNGIATIQDLGRPGFSDQGVPPCGVQDPVSSSIVNYLVGNPANAAVLELVYGNLSLTFSKGTWIAWIGGEADAAPRQGTPIQVLAGQPVEFGAFKRGMRAWIAVQGGFNTPPVMNSRSTLVRFGIGSRLKAGDELPIGPTDHSGLSGLSIPKELLPPLPHDRSVLRYVPSGTSILDGQRFQVSPKSDDMALRLEGGQIQTTAGEQVSAPVVPGVIQVPPSGEPILLMSQCQTVGGYPRAGFIASVDRRLAAQLRPGDSIGFEAITFQEARALRDDLAAQVAKLEWGLSIRYGQAH